MGRGVGAITALALALLTCGGKPQLGGTGTDAGAQDLTACGLAQQGGHACPASLCGNGRIDTCQGGESTELCDGKDLASRTCTSLGYFGGTLACTSSCTLDERGCVSCGSDARISACIRSAAGAAPAGLSLAATFAEVDVAWMDSAPIFPTPHLHFTRYRPDFTLLSDTHCFGPADAFQVGVAALGSGWVVGTLTGSNTNTGGGVYLATLDGRGNVLGSRTVANEARSPFAFRLTTRPNGGALLTWVEGSPNNQLGNLHAEELGPDGSSASTAMGIASNVANWSAIAMPDGFLLAAESVSASGPVARSIQLFVLGLDGSLTMGGNIATLDPTQVGLAWTGSEARLWYQARETDPDSGSPNDGSELQRVAADGSLVGAPAVVETLEESGPMLLFATGSDTVILRTNYGIQYLERIAENGAAAWPAVAAAESGSAGGGYFSLDMVPQAGDAVVAWGEGAALSFERIRISP